MKKRNYLKRTLLSSILLVFISVISWCQMPPKGDRESHGHKLLNLSDDQKEQMKTFKLEFIKQITPLENELEVKNAQLHAKSIGDNIDIKSVNKLIDEIGDIKTQIAKDKFAHRLKMRSILNDEQKIIFDAKPDRHNMAGKGEMEMHNKGKMMHNRGECDGKCHQQKGKFKENKEPSSDQKEIEELG